MTRAKSWEPYCATWRRSRSTSHPDRQGSFMRHCVLLLGRGRKRHAYCTERGCHGGVVRRRSTAVDAVAVDWH
eukprot:4377765-Pyramimonas_sp.AAC.1